MGAKKKNKSGSIPSSVFNQINEHAIGGFVIFYFNSENGLPEHVVTFDSPAHCLALQKYVSDWSRALEEVTLECAIESIKKNKPGDATEEVE